ncbi:MAG: ABC transporter ATP-binding protein [Deinococcales bacterium]
MDAEPGAERRPRRPADPPLRDAVVATQGLGRTFGSGEGAVQALQELTLEVRRGEVFGLLGHNGAGKTTTVRLLNGVLRSSSGSARVLGLDPREDGPALRARSGVLTETPALDERLAVQETLELFGRIYGLRSIAAAARATELLREFGLEGRAREPVGTLSKGMKQRLALARTLVHEPDLLFLDEPTAGLDPVASREVHDLIRTLTRDERRTVVLCTHNLVEAQRLCTRVAVLQNGALVAQGTPAELSQRLQRGREVHLEVPAERVSAAAEALRTALDGRRVAHIGAGATPGTLLLEGAAPEAVAEAVAALVAAGIPVYAAVPHEADLEDAYFALMDAPTHGNGAP